MWSGLSLGVTPAVTALLAPFWGRVSDRFGRKLMVERSLVSFVFLMGGMAYATQAWHVFALRAVQGLFAGYGGIALTMAAESAPPDRTAYAIGTVQTAQRLGPALGPVIGGAVAQMVGLRNAFLMTSGFYVVALAIVFFLYEERHGRPSRVAAGAAAIRFKSVLAFENFILLMAVIFGLQLVDRSYGPILPLYVAQAWNAAAAGPVDRRYHFLGRGRRGRGRQPAVHTAAALASGADDHGAGGSHGRLRRGAVRPRAARPPRCFSRRRSSGSRWVWRRPPPTPPRAA